MAFSAIFFTPKRLAASLLLSMLLSCPLAAMAQATRMMMPEGTNDTYIGLALVNNLNVKSGDGENAFFLPIFGVQWSNGAFLNLDGNDGLSLGMHLSDDPNWQYGPIMTVRSSEQRFDTPDGRRNLTVELGSFVSYDLDRNINLNAQLMYGGGDDGRGLYWQAGTSFSTPIASHHNVSLSGGVVWANRAYMQSYFGVTPQQAEIGGNPVYQANSGVLNLYLAGEWQWELSNKYWLYTGLRLSRLGDNAAHSPLVDGRKHASLSTALVYTF